MSFKKNKHDKYVDKLVNMIKYNYDHISTHQKVSRRKRLVAEIDVVATKGDIIHIYEVKCSYRISKAKKQFKRLRKLFPNENLMCYFYCGMSDKLVEVEAS